MRLSGPAAFEVVRVLGAKRIEKCPTPNPLSPGGCFGMRGRGVEVLRLAMEGGATLPCMIATIPGPRSYTGEDVVEIAMPGNPTLVEKLIGRAIGAVPGIRLAGPGEFTARAYLNERLSLAQAEGVASLIAAQTQSELDEAKRLVSGERGRMYNRFTDEAMTLLALVEAGIDFTDQEDVVAISSADLHRRAGALAEEIERVLGGAAGAEAESTLPRVALAGVPNAGKSTLFNALLGRRRAVISDEAGTTRDVLEERLELSLDLCGGGEVLLCDTPGIDGIERGRLDAGAQAASKEFLERADVVIWCDPTGRFDEAGLKLGREARAIRVRTKADLPRDSEGREAIAVSALDGFHLPSLRRAIADGAWGGRLRTGVLPRHRRALGAAARELREIEVEVAGSGRELGAPELSAGRLRRVLDALGDLTGKLTPDDVIGRVFATFCVGK